MTNKTETWREACRKLQGDGVRFEYAYCPRVQMKFDGCFNLYRFKQQPIPDRPDWREWCKRLQNAGVKFEVLGFGGDWWHGYPPFCFLCTPNEYRIAQQPIPDNIGDLMMEETKPEPKEEIQHLALQIQWHEDKLESLKNKTPMREWEYRYPNESTWYVFRSLNWDSDLLYRRKPKKKTYEFYWCVAKVEGAITHVVYTEKEKVEKYITAMGLQQLSLIKKETVEIEEE